MRTHTVARPVHKKKYRVYHTYDNNLYFNNLTGMQIYYKDLIIENKFDNAAEAFECAAYVNHNVKQRRKSRPK